jgi:hypothetical protein
MPGPLMHVAAVFMCPHGAPGQVVSSNARVLVGGTPVATMADQFPIAGCPFQVPVGAGTKPQPCIRVQWMAPATRVLVNGTPPVLATSPGNGLSPESIPQGPPAVTTVQARVVAT